MEGAAHVLRKRLPSCISCGDRLRRAVVPCVVGDDMSAAVRLENITLSYDRHPAVHCVSGIFGAGTLTAIAGPNGAGKSTLLKGIAGLLAPDEGRVVIENGAPCDIAYLPQVTDLERDFPMTVEQMVATGLWQRAGALRAISFEQRQLTLDAIAAVGLSGFAHRTLDTLSAGQFQRALFARLVLQDAKIILLDEPFNAIDADTTAQLLGIVKRWQSEGRTVICVLHDFAQIRDIFPECVLMARSCVAWGKTYDALHPEKLMQARIFQPAFPARAEECAPHDHDKHDHAHGHSHGHHP